MFLVFLRERGYISREAFLEMHADAASIEITSVGSELDGVGVSDARSPVDGVAFGSAERTASGPRPARRAPGERVIEEEALRYALLGLIGEGGMGCVHVAKDLTLRRKVALKQLKEEATRTPDALERFMNEAQITAQLDHPNIVPVYSLQVRPDGTASYSMKLVQGKTLQRLIAEAGAACTMGAPEAEEHSLPSMLEHFVNLCEALAFAHNKGVIHRDLKPENIMLGQFNELYVMDWGLARLLRPLSGADADDAAMTRVRRAGDNPDGSDITSAGDVLGTPRYMSPEQADGRNVDLDGRSDQYALGLILFELCTFRKAIPGTTPLEVWKNARGGRKVPLTHLSPRKRVPRELKAIIEKATALRPDDRYKSVKHLADDIRRYLHGDAVLARPDTALQKALRAIGRHREATLLAAVVAVLLSAGASATWALYQRSSAASAREVAAHQREALTKTAQSASEKEGLFMMAVVRKSEEVSARLLSIEASVEGLARAAAQAMISSPAGGFPIFFKEDFAPGGRASAGLVESPSHKVSINPDRPVWVLAPAADRGPALAKIQHLAATEAAFQHSCLRGEDGAPLASADARGRALAGTVPILWCYLGTPEGAGALYPGLSSVPEGYDPRARPWYLIAENKRMPTWGSPYLDPKSGTYAFPCSVSVYDADDRLLGVAGVTVNFNFIVKHLVSLDEKEAFSRSLKQVFLLDSQGRVLVRSEVAGGGGVGIALGAQSLEAFYLPDIIKEIEQRRSGYREVDAPEGPVLVAFTRMSVLGWYYVVTASAEAVRGE